MKVAICDDEILCRARVLDIAEEYAEQRKDRNITFDVFSDPEQLLSASKEQGEYDIYILDIVMPGMNGIQLGEQIRNTNRDSKIIFLTSSEEYAIESFRVRAFHYLLKPIDKDAFFSVMDEAVSSLSIKKDRSLIVKTKENNTRITFDSILYGELSRRAVVYHLTDGKIVESTSLRTTFTDAVSELVKDKRFTMCGASMVANLHHITMVEIDAVVFLDKYKVYLGKKTCRELRLAWNEYWLSEGI